MRRGLIIALSLAAIVVAASLVWVLWFRPQPSEQPPALQPTITFYGYEIMDLTGVPVLVVNFSTNVYPITVRLLKPDKRTVADEAQVEIPEDIPLILYLPTKSTGHGVYPASNVIPGTYYLRFIYKKDVLLHKPIDIRLDLNISDVSFYLAFDEWVGWYIFGVNLTVRNEGNTPAYIDRVDVYGGSDHTWFWIDGIVRLLPGDEQFISVKEEGLFSALKLGEPGTYNITVTLDLGSKSITYETTLTIPAPEITFGNVILRVEEYPTAWELYKVVMVVNNEGNGTAYIYEVDIDVRDVGSDFYRFTEPVILGPGESTTLIVDVHIYIYEPGTYDVIIWLDIGYTLVKYTTSLTVG